jgi:hypothetical protein
LDVGIRIRYSSIMGCHRNSPRENVEIDTDTARKQCGELKAVPIDGPSYESATRLDAHQ